MTPKDIELIDISTLMIQVSFEAGGCSSSAVIKSCVKAGSLFFLMLREESDVKLGL